MTDSIQKKRKWDLDDQGQRRSEDAPSQKISKLDNNDSNEKDSDKVDAAKAASAAAAKINALLMQKGIPLKEGSSDDSSHKDKRDAEFSKDIPINDLKNRYMLTRGATQAQIQRETGADVTTRGKYYPDKNLATPAEPPLYLHVTASTREALDKAVAKIEELIETAVVPAPGSGYPHQNIERRERKFLEEKIFIGIENSPHFNLRAKIVGPHGAYVKHIQNETGARVQLKGKGSGFYETSTGQESEEPIHIHISCSRQEGLEKAVQLTQDLIDTVKAEYERSKQQPYNRPYNRGYGNYGAPPPPPGSYYGAGYGAPPPPPPPPGANPPLPPGTPPGAPGSETGSSPAAPATSSGEQTDANGASAQNAYPGYDAYNQYYGYYGQYSYDPNYYAYYGYAAPPQTGSQDSAAANQQQPPPPPSSSASGDEKAAYAPGSSVGDSYNAVPPPPQL